MTPDGTAPILPVVLLAALSLTPAALPRVPRAFRGGRGLLRERNPYPAP